MRSPRQVVVLSVAVVALTACTANEADTTAGEAPTATIGVLAPLSGPNAAVGEDAVQGAELAIALVNEADATTGLPLAAGHGLPGLGGQQLTLSSADTTSDPDVGASAAVELVTGKRVAGLVGAYDPLVTVDASQRTERLEVPFVNGDATADHLTRQGLDWFFRVGPTDRTLGAALFSVLQDRPPSDTPSRRVAILAAGDPVDFATAATIEELAAENGYTVTTALGIKPDGDLAAPLARVRDADPDVVFLVAASSADAVLLVEAVRQLNDTPPAVMALGAGFADPAFTRDVGRQAEGLFRGVAWSAEIAQRGSGANALMGQYEAAYNEPMTPVAAGSFTATLTLAQAFNSSGTLEAEPVRTALTTLNLPGRHTIMPWDDVQFDPTHQNAGAVGTVEQFRQGKPRAVFPRELAQVAPAWPLADGQAEPAGQ